jgi:hypothetical protein
MLDWSERLAGWLQGQGYTGLLGLDFVEYADPETAEVRTILAELHPGMDGATYPLAIQQRLNGRPARMGPPGERGVRLGHAGAPAHDLRPVPARRRAVPLLAPYRLGDRPLPREPAGPGTLRRGDAGGSRDEVLRAYGELQTWCRREDRAG